MSKGLKVVIRLIGTDTLSMVCLHLSHTCVCICVHECEQDFEMSTVLPGLYFKLLDQKCYLQPKILQPKLNL